MIKLYKHQIEAADFCEGKSGAMLRMEQGLGKTFAALEVARRLHEKEGLSRVLVIAPNGIHKQWAEEAIPQFFEGTGVKFKTVEWSGSLTNKEKIAAADALAGLLPADITFLCTNIDTFSTNDKWQKLVDYAEGQMCILDESHLIKNSSSKRSAAVVLGTSTLSYRSGGEAEKHSVGTSGVHSIKSNFRWRLCLTGTPVAGRVSDVFMQIAFLADEPMQFFRDKFGYTDKTFATLASSFMYENEIIMERQIFRNGRTIYVNSPVDEFAWGAVKNFGSCKEVAQRYYTFIRTHQFRDKSSYNEEKRTAAFKDIIFSRFKKDCIDLPDKVFEVRKPAMSAEMRKIYNQFSKFMTAEYDGKPMTARDAITKMIRLRQICGGFIKPDGEPVEVFSKNAKLEMMISDLENTKPPAIVVTQFIPEVDLIAKALKKAFPEWRIEVHDGERKVSSDGGSVTEEFAKGEIDVLVANQTTICTGYNFQNCSTMMFYSNGFSYIERAQIEDRIHRIGTSASPTYIDYAYRDSADEVVLSSLKRKSFDSDAFCKAFGYLFDIR